MDAFPLREGCGGLPPLIATAVFCFVVGWPGPMFGADLTGTNDPVVLTTGRGPALVSTNIVLGWDFTWSSVKLQLDFGFATQETNNPGTFLDSFSLSLQNGDHSGTALLLTADYWGVNWAHAHLFSQSGAGHGLSLGLHHLLASACRIGRPVFTTSFRPV
jgi:hypothetical protein